MRRKQKFVPGLSWRNGRAYVQREHPRLPNGRLYKALGTSDEAVAVQRLWAVNTLMDRGDWPAIARWAAGELDISDVVRAVREGDYRRLAQLSVEGPRLGEMADWFLARTEATNSTQTYRIYASALKQLREALGDDYPMAVLTRATAEAFLHGVKDTTGGIWMPNSQASARGIYKTFWELVIEREAEEADRKHARPVLVKNPWARAKVPVRRKTRKAYLSVEEWTRLITAEHIRATPKAAFLALACLAGLRRAEIIHLRTDIDVELSDTPMLHIQSRTGKWPWKPKHDHSERDLELSDIPALRAILHEHERRGYAGQRYFIHPAGRDTPMSPATAEKWAKDALTSVGLKYGRDASDALTLHSLRHTFGTWLASKGVPFHVIAELMGNTPQMVMETYAHVVPGDRQDALRVLGKMTHPTSVTGTGYEAQRGTYIPYK